LCHRLAHLLLQRVPLLEHLRILACEQQQPPLTLRLHRLDR